MALVLGLIPCYLDTVRNLSFLIGPEATQLQLCSFLTRAGTPGHCLKPCPPCSTLAKSQVPQPGSQSCSGLKLVCLSAPGPDLTASIPSLGRQPQASTPFHTLFLPPVPFSFPQCPSPIASPANSFSSIQIQHRHCLPLEALPDLRRDQVPLCPWCWKCLGTFSTTVLITPY